MGEGIKLIDTGSVLTLFPAREPSEEVEFYGSGFEYVAGFGETLFK